MLESLSSWQYLEPARVTDASQMASSMLRASMCNWLDYYATSTAHRTCCYVELFECSLVLAVTTTSTHCDLWLLSHERTARLYWPDWLATYKKALPMHPSINWVKTAGY